ncbi:MAG: protein jag [Spirochaetaceae bacterium]|jgi:spoIIIJ-associated protein|nr:protein jag [Spirochaetaceae bacterium]
MIKEFEGRTEKEAIDKAVEELGLEQDCFDVEIVETKRGGFFKKPLVKIRIHTSDLDGAYSAKQGKRPGGQSSGEALPPKSRAAVSDMETLPPDTEFEKTIIAYLDKTISLMGIEGKTSIIFREKRKIGIDIASPESSFIIGKKGKTLEALQVIASAYAAHSGHEDTRILIDCENYRLRREESLVRLAYGVADRVRESRVSVLLEPMNPFDRRIIHTTLNDSDDVETKSEGRGLYKQVRVFYKGPEAPRAKHQK